MKGVLKQEALCCRLACKMPSKADLELIVEQLKRQLQEAEKRANQLEAAQEREAVARLSVRQTGNAGSLSETIQDWVRFQRDHGETLVNQERLEVQWRDAESRAEAAE